MFYDSRFPAPGDDARFPSPGVDSWFTSGFDRRFGNDRDERFSLSAWALSRNGVDLTINRYPALTPPGARASGRHVIITT